MLISQCNPVLTRKSCLVRPVVWFLKLTSGEEGKVLFGLLGGRLEDGTHSLRCSLTLGTQFIPPMSWKPSDVRARTRGGA
eukprot:gene340-biopygen144